ncbi:MAG: hypothetical protein C4547_01180 [Phycisphaerales bacterium]|nr:MAG: hypothetical protein C4547_01180 [Phycisphaerales bacterium]
MAGCVGSAVLLSISAFAYGILSWDRFVLCVGQGAFGLMLSDTAGRLAFSWNAHPDTLHLGLWPARWPQGNGDTLVTVPLWMPLVILAALAIATRPAVRQRPGYCRKCGYDLRGNTSGVCPECGEAA